MAVAGLSTDVDPTIGLRLLLWLTQPPSVSVCAAGWQQSRENWAERPHFQLIVVGVPADRSRRVRHRYDPGRHRLRWRYRSPAL